MVYVETVLSLYQQVLAQCPDLQCAQETLDTASTVIANAQETIGDPSRFIDPVMALYAQTLATVEQQCPDLQCAQTVLDAANGLVASAQAAIESQCPGGADACVQPWVDKVMDLYADVIAMCPNLDCAQQYLALVNNLVATVQAAVADACPGGVDACIQPWIDEVMALYGDVLAKCPDLECTQQVMLLVDETVGTIKGALSDQCPYGVGSCVDERLALVGSLIATLCPNLDCTNSHLDFIKSTLQATADEVCPYGTNACLNERTDYLTGLSEEVVALLIGSCPDLQCAGTQIDNAAEIIGAIAAAACPAGTSSCADESVAVIVAVIERACPELQCTGSGSELVLRVLAAACDGDTTTCISERVDTIVAIVEQNCPNLQCASNVITWAQDLLAELCPEETCVSAIGPLVDRLLGATCPDQDSSACLARLREEMAAAVGSLITGACPNGVNSESPEGEICGTVRAPDIDCPNGITACAAPTPYVPDDMPDGDLEPVPGVTPRVPNIPATPTPQQELVEVDPTVMPELPDANVASQNSTQSSSTEPTTTSDAPVPYANSYCANGQAKAMIYWHGYSSGRGSQGYIVDIDRSDDGWDVGGHWNKWFDYPQGDYPNSASSDIEGFQGHNGRPTPLQLEEGRQYKVRIYYRATQERTYDGYFTAVTGCGYTPPGQAPGIETPSVETYCADGKPHAYISWHGYASWRGAYGYIVDLDYAWETWDGDQHWSKWFDGSDGDYSNSARTSTAGFFGNNGRPTPLVLDEGFNYKVRVFYRKSGERSADRHFTAPSECTPPPPPPDQPPPPPPPDQIAPPSITTYCSSGVSKATINWNGYASGRGAYGYIVDVDYSSDGWDDGSHWNKWISPQGDAASTSSDEFQGQSGRGTPMILEGGRSYKVRLFYRQTWERTPDATFIAASTCGEATGGGSEIRQPTVEPTCTEGEPTATFYWHGYASGRGKHGYIVDVDYADDAWVDDTHWNKWFSSSQGDATNSASSLSDGFTGHGGRPSPMTLEAGREYKIRVYYRLSGERSADAVFSARSCPPTGVRAETSAFDQVDVSWNDVQGASGYQVEVLAEGEASWQKLTTVDSTRTSVSDIGVYDESSYSYRVRATRASGDSEPSTEATVTTPQMPLDPAADDDVIDADEPPLAELHPIPEPGKEGFDVGFDGAEDDDALVISSCNPRQVEYRADRSDSVADAFNSDRSPNGWWDFETEECDGPDSYDYALGARQRIFIRSRAQLRPEREGGDAGIHRSYENLAVGQHYLLQAFNVTIPHRSPSADRAPKAFRARLTVHWFDARRDPLAGNREENVFFSGRSTDIKDMTLDFWVPDQAEYMRVSFRAHARKKSDSRGVAGYGEVTVDRFRLYRYE